MMSLSTNTYLLTLYVTYQQETAIRDMFSRNGWLFRKKDDESETLKSKAKTANEEEAAPPEAGYKMPDSSVNDISLGIRNFDEDQINDDMQAAHVPDTDSDIIPMTVIKVETVTPGSDDLCVEESVGESENKANTSRPKRKQTKQVTNNKIQRTSRGKKESCAEMQSSAAVKHKKITNREAPSETADINRKGVKEEADPDRIALEIELQETDDIDHYETVHKSLSPEEPFNPPSDVQENDGFSPSLGCYYCHECGYTFQLQRWYKIHKWNGRCVYKCLVCSEVFTFRNISLYRDHIKTHRFRAVEERYNNEKIRDRKVRSVKHEQNSDSGRDSTLQIKQQYPEDCERTCKKITLRCNVCSTVFQDRKEMKEHINEVHKDSYKCSHCSKAYASEELLQKHLKKLFGDRKYKCHICERQFHQRGHYEGHMNIHYDRTPYVCEKCDSGFMYKSGLVRHKQGKCKPRSTIHICSFCGDIKSNRSSLKEHMVIEHGTDIMTCNFCRKSFRKPSVYYRHIIGHGLDKVFPFRKQNADTAEKK